MLVSADLSHTHPSQAHLPGYTKGPGVQPFAITVNGAAKTYDVSPHSRLPQRAQVHL